MAVFSYRTFKISLNPDSKKTQGLQTGDIVRRQYYDGRNVIYSLMCVLSYGVDTINRISSPYFIGALLEGDAPQSNELLDFVRITNLFNQERSGALYLTASDEESPFMDVIDGIAKNCSLCWPISVAGEDYVDSFSQYVVIGGSAVEFSYIKTSSEYSRICKIKRISSSEGFIGLKQDFYQYVANPNMVLISFRIKTTTPISINGSLEYVDGEKIDGVCVADTVTDDWEYKFLAIVVGYSGRHLRTFKLDLSNLDVNEEAWIADLNIILLSSISNFQDASKIRVGKLNGVVDPVFGRLDGYGSYLQKLYASQAAHISGTLTAGDENGFGATFYAGKIHRNSFINSIEPVVVGATASNDISSPTGAGKVYKALGVVEMIAQTEAWYNARIGSPYCFSFWAYFKKPGTLSIVQNSNVAATIVIDSQDTHSWIRLHAAWDLAVSRNAYSDLHFSLVPVFSDAEFDSISDDDEVVAIDNPVPDEAAFYFSSPQLESGKLVTQYQPTDNVLNYTNEYGAWFNRGGIGGTMQNPLLKMNFDGEGGIGTRSGSLVLKQDGSGYLANRNIAWDSNGNVTFGEGVVLNWDNLGDDAKEMFNGRSMKIIGQDTFSVFVSSAGDSFVYSPLAIELSLEEQNMESETITRQWYYLSGDTYIPIVGSTGSSFIVNPNADMWGDDSVLTIKCVVTCDNIDFIDTVTIKKLLIDGYSVEVTSNKGQAFQNGDCNTVLNANIFFKGRLVSPSYVAENFNVIWHKYHLPDITHEVQGWWEAELDDQGNIVKPAIDRTSPTLNLDYIIDGQDLYVCELLSGSMSVYGFPIVF